MKPYVKFGLISGVVGLLVIIPIAAVMGVCGPVVPLVAGGIAGFLSAYMGGFMTRQEAAQKGAIAGAISGGMTFIGQLLGGVLILGYIHISGTPTLVGQAPTASSPLPEIITYYASGLGVGLCFGVLGILLGVAAGAAGGALGTRQPPASTPGSGLTP